MLNDLYNSTADKVTLKMIQGLDKNNKPFTAFVALSLDHWSEYEVNKDLSAFQKNIIYLKEGHEVSEKDKLDAKKLFENRYASMTSQRSK